MHDINPASPEADEAGELRALLRERSEEVAALMELIPAAVFISHDPSCARIEGNREGHQMLRVAPAHNISKTAPLPERPAYRVYRDGRELGAEELPLQRAAAERRRVTEELEIVDESGERKHIYGQATPLLDAAGAVRGAVGVFFDVTANKRVEADRERLLQEARLAQRSGEEAIRVRDYFLATVSHQLRTPLNAIMTWTHVLKAKASEPEWVGRGIQAVAAGGEALAHLISNLLDTSRILAGKVSLRRQNLMMDDVVREVVGSLGQRAREKRVVLDLNVSSGVTLNGDRARLEQALSHVLANAIQFTEPGGAIRVRLDQSGATSLLSISDTGIGIDPGSLPHVFERFCRSSDTMPRRANEGVGLGLAIAKHLVELHGGTITATSEGPGRGACFTIRLPAQESSPPPAQ